MAHTLTGVAGIPWWGVEAYPVAVDAENLFGACGVAPTIHPDMPTVFSDADLVQINCRYSANQPTNAFASCTEWVGTLLCPYLSTRGQSVLESGNKQDLCRYSDGNWAPPFGCWNYIEASMSYTVAYTYFTDTTTPCFVRAPDPVWFNMAGLPFDSTAPRMCTPYATSEADALAGTWTVDNCRFPVCNFGAATGGATRGAAVSAAYGVASGESPNFVCPSADMAFVYTELFDPMVSSTWDTGWITDPSTAYNTPGFAKIYVYVEQDATFEITGGTLDATTSRLHDSAGSQTYRLCWSAGAHDSNTDTGTLCVDVGFMHLIGPFRAKFKSRIGSRIFLTQFPDIAPQLDGNNEFVTSDHFVTIVSGGRRRGPDPCENVVPAYLHDQAFVGAGCSNNQAPTLVDYGGSMQNMPVGQTKLFLCEGDCDYDSDCAEGLLCFERSSRSVTPPGCVAGGPADIDYYDFCYDPGPDWTTANYRWQSLPTTPEAAFSSEVRGGNSVTVYDLHTAISGTAVFNGGYTHTNDTWYICWAFDKYAFFIPWGTLEILPPEIKTDVLNFTVIIANADLSYALEFPDEREEGANQGEPWLWPRLAGPGKVCVFFSNVGIQPYSICTNPTFGPAPPSPVQRHH
jgi:hypothetical protein